MSSLIGKTIGGKLITKDTPNEAWEGHFTCPFLKLTSLEFCPTKISGDFTCHNNKLTSLEGCPSEVGGSFYCFSNKLTSLQNIHIQLKKMDGMLNVFFNPIKSHVLGVLLIEGCKSIHIDNERVEDILNKYLKGSRDIFDCQFELIEAGFEEYAQL